MLNALTLAARQAQLPETVPVPSQPLESPYGYIPSLASCVAFLVVFSLLTIAHTALAIRYKYFSALATMCVGGLLEVIGWAGRLWSWKNILLWDPFIMQICCLILGPVFFSAWDYTLLGFCIRQLGPEYSLLAPNAYVAVFVIMDIISLVLQAVGGGGAAVKAQNYEDTTSSTRVMLGGILFQLATTTIFVVLAVDFMVRVMWRKPYPAAVTNWSLASKLRLGKSNKNKNQTEGKRAQPRADGESELTVAPTEPESPRDSEKGRGHAGADDAYYRKAQILLLGVAWATLMIYIRGIYRSIELAQGWTGYVITHQPYFVWLDGFMMVLCMFGLAVTHPGFLLPPGGWR